MVIRDVSIIEDYEGKLYKIHLSQEEFRYVLKHISDYDALHDYLGSLMKWREIDTTRESPSEAEEGFSEHCHCNRGIRQMPNQKKYCPVHGYDYHSSTPTTKKETK